MNEHNEVLDELMGISDLDDRERYKLELHTGTLENIMNYYKDTKPHMVFYK